MLFAVVLVVSVSVHSTLAQERKEGHDLKQGLDQAKGQTMDMEMDFFVETERISANDLINDNKTIFLSDNWKLSTSDSAAFAQPDYDDSHWEAHSTYLGPSDLAFIDWKGVGWFRKKIVVDSSLAGRPLALIFSRHNGASEFYLDGELVYEIGDITNTEIQQAQTSRWPRYISFNEPGVHQLAVRFANERAQFFNDLGFPAGFRILLGDFGYHLNQTREQTVFTSTMKMFITGGLIAFTIIHFLFFFFYPVERNNLYFSLFTGALAILTFSTYQTYFTSSPIQEITYFRLSLVMWLLTVMSALRFTYSLFYNRTPWQFWLFIVAGTVLVFLTWFYHQATSFYRELFVLLTIGEMLRILIVAFNKKKRGVWIIGTGLSFFIGAIFYAIAVNLQLLQGNAALGNFSGSLALIFAMSVYLSQNFARTNKQLQHKLAEVKQLSERSLKQERINKQKELERKLLEAENKRKTQELEEARALQLSMLPKKIPNPAEWDISVYMDTAYEVGGDYYDFSMAKDGTMTVAVGDATGHGMKAGIMVATAKSYFHTLADDYDTLQILRRMSHGIKNMDLKTMFMALSLVKCNGSQVRITAAGMPPGLIYRHKTKEVERITIKGMPLGTRVDYPYEERCYHTEQGDTILLLSDGLLELFNSNREMFGMKRLEKVFKEYAELPSSDIMESLKKQAKNWLGDKKPEDDITMVVLKAR